MMVADRRHSWSSVHRALIPRRVGSGYQQNRVAGMGDLTFQSNPTTQMFWQGAPVAMNPAQFATQQTAQTVATLLGGAVVTVPLAGGSGSPQYQIAVPGSENLLNAGLVADLINKYGANDPNVKAILARDLGISTAAVYAVDPSTVGLGASAPSQLPAGLSQQNTASVQSSAVSSQVAAFSFQSVLPWALLAGAGAAFFLIGGRR